MDNRKQGAIRVLLVDDHPVVLEGIRNSLKSEKNIRVVGLAANGEEALARTLELMPDLVVMDISMPKMNGIEAIGKILAAVPAMKILVLTMHDRKEYVIQILRAGARGYLLKDVYPAELVRAIEAVHEGRVCFSPSVNRLILRDYSAGGEPGRTAGLFRLSRREREVLSLIAEGNTSRRIAQKLLVSIRTVETHRERIMQKLNIHTVAGLTKYAITNGIAQIE